METFSNMSKDEILELIDQVHWYHSFEIYPGIITPGICRVYPKLTFERFGLSPQLKGKRILEIGTLDGPYAFELESRGADVVATDIQDPDNTGFNIAKKILNSNVEYVRTSVYDLTKNLDRKFDIVLFMGVFYHLKYPLLAFEQIYDILKDDGLLLFEGEYFSHYAETLEGKKVRNRLLLALLAYSAIPMTLFYSGSYKNDSSNWHIPNIACLKSWMMAAHFRVVTLETTVGNIWMPSHGKFGFLKKINSSLWYVILNDEQRVLGTAVKIKAESMIEHALAPKKTLPQSLDSSYWRGG